MSDLSRALDLMQAMNNHLADEHGELLNRTGMEHDKDDCAVCLTVREANDLMEELSGDQEKFFERAESVLREFVSDVASVGGDTVTKEEWPDLWITWKKAMAILKHLEK